MPVGSASRTTVLGQPAEFGQNRTLSQCGTPAQPETPAKCPPQQAIHWWLTDNEVLTMLDFRKKRQTAEQQRRVERVLDAQERFLALYEQPEGQ